MRSSSSSACTTMWRPHICASRNSPLSTHAKQTSFHVRVLLAFLALSTAPLKSIWNQSLVPS